MYALRFLTAIFCSLLCSVVDNVEALIDEWFPGLRNVSIIPGDALVKPCAICPMCTGQPSPPQFRFSYYFSLSYNIHHISVFFCLH